MNPGALRALEFDRIVVGRRRPRGDADRARAAGGAASVTDAAEVAAAQRATSEGTRFLADHPGFPLRAPADLDDDPRRARRRRPARSSRCACSAWPTTSTRSSSRAAPSRRLPAPFPILRRARRHASRRSRARSPTSAARSIRPARSPTTPARRCASIRERLRRQRAKLRTHARRVPARTRHAKYLQEQVVTDRNGRYVLMVRAEHRARDSRHRPRRLGQRRQPVPRAARHGRDQQRHRRARGAGGRGSPPHPARADRRVPRPAGRSARARSTSPPSSTSSRRARASREMVGGIEPAIVDRRHASSCAARGIRC